jgi:nucleoside-diphosphate-sugar epimerase
MGMKVLITGCQGFIAKNLAQHLKKQGHYVVGLDKKLKTKDPIFVDEFVGHNMEGPIKFENDFDRVYHLSADVPNSKYVDSAQMATGRSNPMQSINALDFAAKNKSHFVYACSAMMYNTDVQEYAKYYNMKVALPIFHAMYGPYLDIFENSKVVAAMCVKILNASDPGEIEIWGDGRQVRSFCYIDDLMIGLDKLIEHNVQVPVNMGSDEAITMTQLADMLIKISGKKITKKYLPAGPAGCMRRNSDNTKIMKLTGWKPNYSLEQGLRNTFEYVKSQVLTK